jgi:hypothetical protein
VRAAPRAQRDRARLRLDQHEHPPRRRDRVPEPRAARAPRPARALPSSAAQPPTSGRCPSAPESNGPLTPIFLLRGGNLS